MKHLWHRSDLWETMSLILVIWLCSLVLIGLLVGPLFGARVAGVVAVGLLLVLLAVCWGTCIYRLLTARNRE